MTIPIVITLRDPLDRIRSLYFHLARYGEMKNRDFAGALRDVPVLLDSSRYAHHVERWRAVFGPERVHVLLQDDLPRTHEIRAIRNPQRGAHVLLDKQHRHAVVRRELLDLLKNALHDGR